MASPPSPHGSTPLDQRMLAAIVPQGKQAWFFKVTGSTAELEGHSQAFRTFIKSLRFEDEQPLWNLPELWQSRPGGTMRYATLILGGEEGAPEMSVTPLMISGDLDSYILQNVNRWRNQVGLPPIAQEAMPDETEEVDLDGVKAILVDLNPGAARAPAADDSSQSEPAATASALKFQTPDGWKVGEKVVSRGDVTLRHEAAFEIVDGDGRGEVTVDRLPALGSLRDNIDRWRRQIGLASMTDDQFKSDVAEIKVGGLKGDYVELIGDEQSVLGAVILQGDSAWYFKLKGDGDLVKQQKDAFRSFLNSIQF